VWASHTHYHVESALIARPELFAAATIVDGIDASYMQALLYGPSASFGYSVYGTEPFGDGLKPWIERAPGFHLDHIHTPLRIEALRAGSVLGEWEIYASLRAQHKPVDLVYFPQGQHVLQRPLERMASQQGNVDWFRFWLKGEEDSDPTKAEQYKLWRELKKLQEENEKKTADRKN
jgi:hypothetical protein